MHSSNRRLVVRYLGRRSGLPRTVRVRCTALGRSGELLVRVSRPDGRRWWRNFISPWPVTVVDRREYVHASGEAVAADSREGKRLAAAYFERFPVPKRHASLYDPSTLIFLRLRPYARTMG